MQVSDSTSTMDIDTNIEGYCYKKEWERQVNNGERPSMQSSMHFPFMNFWEIPHGMYNTDKIKFYKDTTDFIEDELEKKKKEKETIINKCKCVIHQYIDEDKSIQNLSDNEELLELDYEKLMVLKNIKDLESALSYQNNKLLHYQKEVAIKDLRDALDSGNESTFTNVYNITLRDYIGNIKDKVI